MKFCKDCKHCDERGKYDMCMHPSADRNRVTGNAFCDFERTYGHPCGLEGSHFEGKPIKWFKRIFK